MQAQNEEKNIKYLIGNWKANKTLEEARFWIKKVKAANIRIHPNIELVLCPSFIHLQLLHIELPSLTLGCQDLSPFADGAYTGAVTARMVAGLVKYVILGHSERRRYFSETPENVALKAIQALDYNLIPIIAVDKNNWLRQLNALGENIFEKSIIMYEPPEAISEQIGTIGQGKAAPLDEIVNMIKEIKSNRTPKAVIYGGSVKSHNLQIFLKEPLIDGVLPGSASLNADEWLKMIKLANQ